MSRKSNFIAIIFILLGAYSTNTLTRNMDGENIDDSIYGIVALAVEKLQQVPHNIPQDLVLADGINGTCFFISPNTFVTANHVVNSKVFDKNIYLLLSSNGAIPIISNISILKEDPDKDITYCQIPNNVKAFIKVGNNSEYKLGHKFGAYGFSKTKTKDFKIRIEIKVEKSANEAEIIYSTYRPLELERIECNFFHLINGDCKSSDSTIHLKSALAHVYSKAIPVGFSGGPILDLTNNQVITFSCMELFVSDNNRPDIPPQKMQLGVVLKQ